MLHSESSDTFWYQMIRGCPSQAFTVKPQRNYNNKKRSTSGQKTSENLDFSLPSLNLLFSVPSAPLACKSGKWMVPVFSTLKHRGGFGMLCLCNHGSFRQIYKYGNGNTLMYRALQMLDRPLVSATRHCNLPASVITQYVIFIFNAEIYLLSMSL